MSAGSHGRRIRPNPAVTRVERALDRGQGERSAVGNFEREFAGLFGQVGIGHHAVDQADLLGLLGRDLGIGGRPKSRCSRRPGLRP